MWGNPDSQIREVFVCGIRNPGKLCLWNTKSLALESGIQLTELRNPTSDWNPESKLHWLRIESITWNTESMAWNPESNSVLDSLTWSEKNQTTTTNAIKPLSLSTKSCTANSLKYMLCKLFIYFFQCLNLNFWIWFWGKKHFSKQPLVQNVLVLR